MYHIYFLDVTVFDLCVNERIVRDAEGDTDFLVSIDLINLPRLIVRRNKSAQEIVECDNRWVNLNFNAGCVSHFVAKGTNLVNAIKRKPLIIGIYRVGERFPVCNSVAPLTGCVCDMITESIEKSYPFEFDGTFDLTDPGDNPAGHVILKLVLTDLGRHVTTLYTLDRDAFLLKNRHDGAEYKCIKTKNCDYMNNSAITRNNRCSAELASKNLIREIVGISLVARDLSGRLEEKRVRQHLEILEKVSDGEFANADKVEGKKSKKKSNKKTGKG